MLGCHSTPARISSQTCSRQACAMLRKKIARYTTLVKVCPFKMNRNHNLPQLCIIHLHCILTVNYIFAPNKACPEREFEVKKTEACWTVDLVSRRNFLWQDLPTCRLSRRTTVSRYVFLSLHTLFCATASSMDQKSYVVVRIDHPMECTLDVHKVKVSASCFI